MRNENPSLFLALINALLAGLLLTYTLTSNEVHETVTFWLAESIIALSVIIIGILTWIASIKETGTNFLLISGLYLVILGAVTIVWTYHLVALSENIKYYMALYGASLTTQGIESLLGFGIQNQTMTIT